MIKPLHGMVLLEPEAEATETASGIITSTNDKRGSSYGKVLDPGIADVATGSRVLYNRYMGEEVDGLVVIDQDQILAVCEEDEE